MKTTRHFTCKECNKHFDATYDTHEKTAIHEAFCPCKKARVIMPGIHRYQPNEAAIVDNDILLDTETIYDEDIIHFDDETNELLSRAIGKGKRINQGKGKQINQNAMMFDYYRSNDKLELTLEGESYRTENLTIEAKIRLLDEYGWSETEARERLARFKESLKCFIKIEDKILDGSLDIDKVQTVVKDESLGFYDIEAKRKDLYDYKCIC